MDIPDFCNCSLPQLKKILQETLETEQSILDKFAEPDFVHFLCNHLKTKTIDVIDDDIIELAICLLANTLNKEIINRELFRRKME